MQTIETSLAVPEPPARLLDNIHPIFAPAEDLKAWAFETFIHEGAPLQNPDHAHLVDAEILFVWSSTLFRRAGKDVIGTAQTGCQQGSLGKKELLESRYREWYGNELPDFVITVCAPFFREAPPTSICALIEHELYHCAQAKDEFGNPKFTDKNWPVWTLRGHDIEEFVGVVARYGAHSPELMALQTVLDRGPLIPQASVEYACGCGARV